MADRSPAKDSPREGQAPGGQQGQLHGRALVRLVTGVQVADVLPIAWPATAAHCREKQWPVTVNSRQNIYFFLFYIYIFFLIFFFF